ncbi:MAG TPA: IclR family transcriptional regulator [Alphaproteobacteria bacterium]|nr:IclR family transcriptional regulator [Alphaproteobacteria bacterium]
MAPEPPPADVVEAERRGIQSVENSVRVLEALAEAGCPLPLGAIGTAAGMSPSKAHRYLASFVRKGVVRQDPATGTYDLGVLALRIGLAALSRVDIVDLASAAMRRLTDETGVTSLLNVWGDRGPTIVRWQRSHRPFVTSLSLGSVLPLLTSATGRVFLAFLPRQMTKELVARERRYLAPDDAAPRSERELAGLIADVRTRRLAWADGSVIPGLRAVSAPVLDLQGELSGAITLIATDPSLTEAGHPAALALAETCASLSRELGEGTSRQAAPLPATGAKKAGPHPSGRAGRSASAARGRKA